MDLRPLGRSGLLVSCVGLGGNNFAARLDLQRGRDVIDAAQDCGITLIDTAELYGGPAGFGASEAMLGELLQGRRESFVVATKFGMLSPDHHGPAAGAHGSRAYIRRAVEGSLRRLRTDWIDLYQLHLPDPVTPVEETAAAMTELVTEGKVRYLGHSNLAGWQVAQFAQHGSFISAQNHWSLLEREVEKELVPACEAYGVGVLPFFPLANGLLTGKVSAAGQVPEGSRLASRPEWITETRLAKVAALTEWAQARDRTVLQAAIAGLASRQVTGSVIAGATSAEQVRANAAAADWVMTPEELTELDQVVPR
jgi:aryl-alcohol dehydrogenase-like predicted oxidoreductase